MQRALTATRCLVQDGALLDQLFYDLPGQTGYILNAEGGVDEITGPRLVVEGLVLTDEELEEGTRRVLVASANNNVSIRSQDLLNYFNHLDLVAGPTAGMLFDAGADGLLFIAEPEYVGTVAHLISETGERRVPFVWNPRAVVRLDETAPEWAPEPGEPIYLDYAALIERAQQFRKKKTKRLPGPERKARALLFRYLTREQKWELRGHKRFTLKGQDGETYRVYAYSGGNVKLVQTTEFKKVPQETVSFCVVANAKREPLPLYDLLLAQKLLLTMNIGKFRSIAHITRLHEQMTQLSLPLPEVGYVADPYVQDTFRELQWARRIADAMRQIEYMPEAPVHITERVWARETDGVGDLVDKLREARGLIGRRRAELGRQLAFPEFTSPAVASGPSAGPPG